MIISIIYIMYNCSSYRDLKKKFININWCTFLHPNRFAWLHFKSPPPVCIHPNIKYDENRCWCVFNAIHTLIIQHPKLCTLSKMYTMRVRTDLSIHTLELWLDAAETGRNQRLSRPLILICQRGQSMKGWREGGSEERRREENNYTLAVPLWCHSSVNIR